MKKVCNKWKVFLIVLCMLFTMIPSAVMAEEPLDPITVETPADQTPNQPSEPPADPPTEPGATPPADPPIDPVVPPTDPPTDPEEPLQDEIVPFFMQTQIIITKLELSYKYFNNSGRTEKLKIASVIYDDGGESFTDNPNTIDIDNSIFSPRKITANYDASKYVPDKIIDTNGITWELIDKGEGQQTILVTKGITTKRDFHYKKCPIGSLTVTKVITGDIPDPDDPVEFIFNVYKYVGHGSSGSYSEPAGTLSVEGSGTTESISLFPGKYKIIEADVTAEGYERVTKERFVTVAAGGTYNEIFTNHYTAPTTPVVTPGSITIQKVITRDDDKRYTDPDPDNPPVFTFTVSLSDAKYYEVNITGAGFVTLSDLTPGEYKVTEEDNPFDDYTPATAPKTFDLDPGENETVVFTNVYTEPGDEPSIRINKTVAEYDGSNIPNNSDFVGELSLDRLNKQVIYKIDLTCDSEIEYTTVRLKDLYNNLNITDKLLVLDNGSLVEANTVYDDEEFPNCIEVYYKPITTFYYIDTLTESKTYTNTAYLYEPDNEQIPTIMASVSDSESESKPLASSSAVVIVNYQSGGGNTTGGGGGGSSHHNYQVIYNANYPVVMGTSGTVPIDNNDYSYNSKVIVKGNTGDLKVENYSFTGWNTKADGTGTAYQPSDSFNIKSDVTLYAQWKAGDEATPAANDEGNAAALSAVTTDGGLDDIPKTGDSTPVVPMLLLGFFSLAAIALLGRKNAVDTAAK